MVHGAPKPVGKLYSVPRRFDLATIMVVTIAFACLFGAMRLLNFPPIAMVIVAGFISCVGIAQALLFRGNKPRMASALAGAVCYVGIFVIADIASGRANFDVRDLPAFMGLAGIGTIFGYIAGVAVGSVFLLSDMSRKSIQRRFDR